MGERWKEKLDYKLFSEIKTGAMPGRQKSQSDIVNEALVIDN